MTTVRNALSVLLVASIALAIAGVLIVQLWPRGPAQTAGLPALQPGIPPEVPWSDCDGAYAQVDHFPLTVEFATQASTAVVAATVIEVGQGQWNTPGGKPAATTSSDVNPFDVMRMLRLRVDESISGRRLGETTTVWIRGGTLGCALFSYSDYPDSIKPGQRFALFVNDQSPKTEVGAVPFAWQMWSIDEKVVVSTPEDGKMSLGELAAKVGAAESPGQPITP